MCTGDIQGGSWDVLEDPPDSVEGCVYREHPGRILGCPEDPPDSVDTRDMRMGPRGSSGQCGGLCVLGTSREDPGMS